ncbi:MAG TPA: hypothetical protein ENH82_13175 [bacterium]|nr:hypothetical protein [bacterium]
MFLNKLPTLNDNQKMFFENEEMPQKKEIASHMTMVDVWTDPRGNYSQLLWPGIGKIYRDQYE